jgi:hypothetical protein
MELVLFQCKFEHLEGFHESGINAIAFLGVGFVRQLDQAAGVRCQKLELQCYRAYKHTWSPMSETKEH